MKQLQIKIEHYITGKVKTQQGDAIKLTNDEIFIIVK